MRLSEIIHLKKESIDLKNQVIILESEEQKGKRLSYIPLNNTMIELLWENMRKSKSEYVFKHSRESHYKKHDSVTKLFSRICKRAGIQGATFHSLRHTFATRALEQNANISAVSEILRHKDPKTTKRYLHPEHSVREVVRMVEVPNPFKKSEQKSEQITA
jgi:integrase